MVRWAAFWPYYRLYGSYQRNFRIADNTTITETACATATLLGIIVHMSQQRTVPDLNVNRLLESWRWLCPQSLTLLDRNPFGDLFLRDDEGSVFWLNVALGLFTKVADSEAQFFDLAAGPERRKEWFAEADANDAAERGLVPGINQCIGFSVPLVFAESGSPDTAYIADIYDHVGFLGDLHRQIATLPHGAKVRLRVKA